MDLQRTTVPNNPVRCDRQLFEKLKALDANELAEKKRYLTKYEMKAVMTPRDAIVQHFRMLHDAAITAHRWIAAVSPICSSEAK